MNRKMCDVHIHIVPGVDDGAIDMQMALSMMISAYRQGIFEVIATPHSHAFDYSELETKWQFQQLCDQMAQLLPEMTIACGCEIYCEETMMDKIITALRSGKYPTMNGTDYILVEFSQWIRPEKVIPCIKQLLDAGWKPVIAHMERYDYLCRNVELVNALREMGCLIQVNASSFAENQNGSIRDWARYLAQEKKIDFLGSDAHRTYYRPPEVTEGLNWLYENLDQEYADEISWKNAHKLLICRNNELT